MYAKSNFARFITVLAVLTGLLVVSLITVAFFKSLDLSSAENKVFILLERMKIREIHDKICKIIITNCLAQITMKFKIKKIRIKMKIIERDNQPHMVNEIKRLEKQIRNYEKKKSKLNLELKHLITQKNQSKKSIQNINTSGYIMESIIDDIVSITTEIEDLGFSINSIIRELTSNVRKDDIIISTIKKKLKEESEKKMNKKNKNE
jgi:hypothetical protein